MNFQLTPEGLVPLFTDKELLIITAAVKTCTPTGGGSVENNLSMALCDYLTRCGANTNVADAIEKSVERYSEQIIADAVDYGLVVRTEQNQ